ncbi:PREDICTED: uncharacterized protein LOC106817719 [Priapulus caudatus]|uniref:Uncharacterized protein LOC106817719 n=1 Tax=Priapulus caudatus TaxID=37621 RepID=A0ABM1F0C3_PRICU|nr:PREDICTED: uncharacterized protein LOC106817719 [Priapulus caudatus]
MVSHTHRFRGLDFRPQYKDVSQIYSILHKNTRWLFLTATCTDELKVKILSVLNLAKATIKTVALIPDRKNIYLGVKAHKGLDYMEEVKWLVDHTRLKGCDADKTIIYCR